MCLSNNVNLIYNSESNIIHKSKYKNSKYKNMNHVWFAMNMVQNRYSAFQRFVSYSSKHIFKYISLNINVNITHESEI
jgi:hypothetical protein